MAPRMDNWSAGDLAREGLVQCPGDLSGGKQNPRSIAPDETINIGERAPLAAAQKDDVESNEKCGSVDPAKRLATKSHKSIRPAAHNFRAPMGALRVSFAIGFS